GEADGPVGRAAGAHVGAREAGGEVLVSSGGRVALEWDEDDAVAVLRQGRPVPRAVERDERATPVASRELGARVEQQPVGPPVTRKREDRLLDVRTAARITAVAAVLRREDLPAELEVVVAVGPAEVVPTVDADELLGGSLRALLVREQVGPEHAQRVAPVL